MKKTRSLSVIKQEVITRQREHSSSRFKALLSSLFFATVTSAFAAERPNIVMIVLDDAGYSDLGAMGSEIQTPNIDELADQGVLLTQFHVTPNCSSSRASLMTGMDHHRTGIGSHAGTTENQKGKPGYEGYLNNRVISLATVLRDAGYRTMMTGKWHLGNKNPETWPAGRGFDDSYALLNGGASHWDNTPLFPSKPSTFVEGHKVVELPKNFYSSDFFTTKLINYIEASKEQPFFAFLSFTAPHNPLHAPEDVIKKYKAVYDQGWDVLQESRLKSLKEKGFIEANVKAQPRPKWIPAWNTLDKKAQAISARDMEVYAAMIDRADENIGRLIKRLKQLGKYDNTMFLVFSDNGPSKTTMEDYIKLSNGDIKFLETFNNALGNRGLPGSNTDIGPGWAYGLAAPLRLMKGYQTQGGVLSPLVIKPPANWKKAAKPISTPVHVMDIMPTLLEVAAAKHPFPQDSVTSLAMQGLALNKLIQGGNGNAFEQRGFGGELFGIRAYRQGQWKIFKAPAPYGTDRWQLYDLTTDPGEIVDLAKKYPQRLKALAKSWQSYAAINGVVEPNKPIHYAKPPE
ncbi:MAG: arylsulfatase [Pseudomonadales bacterium]|nr:arylsulfatase [Pseudomonadales bacterium]